MKKQILTLIILLSACVSYSQVHNTDLKGKLGISLYPGANIPAIGNMSSTIKTTDCINPGPHIGMGVSYFFTNTLGVEAVFGYDLSLYKDKFRLNGKQPSILATSFYVDGIYNFKNLFNKSHISPYIKAGIGTYSWRHLDDTPWENGEVVSINGIKQKSSSFGFNAGIGADYSVNKHFSIGILLDYNMYFPKDEEKYGKDFGTQGIFTPELKFTYYLPVH
jgi:outer membrane protein W